MQADVCSDVQMQRTGGQRINSHQLVTISDGGGKKIQISLWKPSRHIKRKREARSTSCCSIYISYKAEGIGIFT